MTSLRNDILRTGHFFVTLYSVIWDINIYPVIKVNQATVIFTDKVCPNIVYNPLEVVLDVTV